MADKVILPGTLIEVIQKYPASPGGAITEDTAAKSLRLDEPNFVDVCKTVFAKGVITEFKEIPEDQRELLQWVDYTPSSYGPPYVPAKWEDGENRDIAVKSMVKVKVNEVESEFIPIFYHPRPKYWDDEDLATDFQAEEDDDGDGGYFKQAWQSFRADDEVVVMLKEGIPVAVVGFADGVPRVGEAIFQMEYDTIDGANRIYQWQPGLRGDPEIEGKGQPYQEFNIENKGSDDLGLGLKKEALIICDTGEVTHEYPTTPMTIGYRIWPDCYGSDPPIEVTYQQFFTAIRQYREYLFTIGPIAYVLQIIHQKLHVVKSCSDEGLDVCDYYNPPYHFVIEYNSDTWLYRTRFAIWSKLYSAEAKEDAIAIGKTHEGLSLYPDTDLNANWVQRYFCKSVASGDEHSMDYYDGPGIKPPNPDFLLPEWGYPWPDDRRGPPWEGWAFQPDWSVRMGISYLINTDNTDRDQIDGSTLKIFTRPHTKAELQAASLWPAGAS